MADECVVRGLLQRWKDDGDYAALRILIDYVEECGDPQILDVQVSGDVRRVTKFSSSPRGRLVVEVALVGLAGAVSFMAGDYNTLTLHSNVDLNGHREDKQCRFLNGRCWQYTYTHAPLIRLLADDEEAFWKVLERYYRNMQEDQDDGYLAVSLAGMTLADLENLTEPQEHVQARHAAAVADDDYDSGGGVDDG